MKLIELEQKPSNWSEGGGLNEIEQLLNWKVLIKEGMQAYPM